MSARGFRVGFARCIPIPVMEMKDRESVKTRLSYPPSLGEARRYAAGCGAARARRARLYHRAVRLSSPTSSPAPPPGGARARGSRSPRGAVPAFCEAKSPAEPPLRRLRTRRTSPSRGRGGGFPEPFARAADFSAFFPRLGSGSGSGSGSDSDSDASSAPASSSSFSASPSESPPPSPSPSPSPSRTKSSASSPPGRPVTRRRRRARAPAAGGGGAQAGTRQVDFVPVGASDPPPNSSPYARRVPRRPPPRLRSPPRP